MACLQLPMACFTQTPYREAGEAYILTYLLTYVLAYLLTYVLTYLLTYLGAVQRSSRGAAQHSGCCAPSDAADGRGAGQAADADGPSCGSSGAFSLIKIQDAVGRAEI